MREHSGDTVCHWAITDKACSCGRPFEFETDLMKHIDEYLPLETKKKQMELFA